MNKKNLKRLQERISNLAEYNDNTESYRLWNQGYNAACKQILEIIEEIKNEEI